MTSWDRYGGGSERPGGPNPPLILAPAALPDPTTIPPREWLLGTMLLRGDATTLIAVGAGGKTSFAIGAALSLVTGRELLGLHVFERCRVWYLTLEDGSVELDRRIAAAMLHHGIPRAEVAGKLFLHAGAERPLILAEPGADGEEIHFTDAGLIEGIIRAHDIGLVIPDPFVRSHKLDENSNGHMDQVMAAANGIAARTRCSFLIPHHTRKSADGTVSDARGASALIWAPRISLRLSGMDKAMAEALDVPPDEAGQYVQVADGKVNLAPKAAARWFRLVGVPLGNTEVNPLYPAGDSVQAIEQWTPPTAWDGLPHEILALIFDDLRRGPAEGEFYAPHRQSKDYWAGSVIVRQAGRTESQAAAVIREWVRNGVLVETEYNSPARQRRKHRCLQLVEARVAEILGGWAGWNRPEQPE